MAAFEAAFFITIALFAYIEFQKRRHLKQPAGKNQAQKLAKKRGKQ